MQVDVGDFLRLKSCVLYTEVENPDQPLINVEVVAHVTRPELRSSEVNLSALLHHCLLLLQSENIELSLNVFFLLSPLHSLP